MKFSLKKCNNAFGILELTVTIAIALVMLSAGILSLDIKSHQQKSRDSKRLSDMMYLDTAINSYRLDTGAYPDLDGIIRTSIVVPATETDPYLATGGWILEDLSGYISRLPVDPINDTTYFYSYIHDDNSYELNSVMEILIDQMENDGGNDPFSYELGNNLNLISP